jgi:hypothetical protein
MRSVLALSSLPWSGAAAACGSCRPLVMARIAAEPFWPTALMLALPIVLLVLIALMLDRAGSGR